ncbi:hypothetical protein ACFFS2_28925 [Streptomyces aurantiacus]|uniref:Uncharacterized protein n=1 Tax=Streptomyces aurantiacus TaxID=47760 RepID=A0A7G1P9F8_9ACTN|nr:hypothetical protein [Streptomyces aurantiacus]BCL30357.1 hypothetical protein GCM10017557_52160 [Streptomyces aurantiacus]
MPSPEHDFLSDSALKIMESAAKSGLFSYQEGSRKLFDFSCDLKKDWSKIISGQTLWKHDRDGIDKDIRTLLTQRDVAAAVYIARHSTQNKRRLAEVTGSFRDTPMRDRLSRLRVFWVPGDFDADNESARDSTYDNLRDEMTKDLLMQVVLGGLTPQDVSRFAASGRPGYPLAILSHVKTKGYRSLSSTSKTLGFSTQILKEEVQRLFVIGFLESESLQGGIYWVSESGNAMLDICSRLRDYLNGNLGEGNENVEFQHICRLLGIDYLSVPHEITKASKKQDLQNLTALLMQHVAQANTDGSVEWPEPYFTLPSV